MKCILIFSLTYYPHFVGGAEVAIKEITDRISSEDIEFHMVTLRLDSALPREEKIGNVFIHRIGMTRRTPTISDLQKFPLKLTKYWYQFAASRAATHLHQRYHFDGIWAMMAHSCAIPAGTFKKRYPEVKYLLSLQEGDPTEYIERLARPVWPLFKRGFTSADILQTISTFLLKWGQRMGFANYAEVVPNAVDIKHFSQHYTQEELTQTRTSFGVTSKDVLLVTTSRLVHKNAVDDVIRALALLPGHIHFIVYGIGPDEELLRKLAKKAGVESRVHFMGQIEHKDMPRALTACTIFIRPSRSEGMGNSFIEAMAAGLPIIATQEGGIADFLFDAKRNPEKDQTGWAVDKNSPKEIVEVVKYIVAHSEQAALVCATAQKLVREHYDWNDIAERMKRLFDRLIRSKSEVV